MNRYFILYSNSNYTFEEVDEFTFNNAEKLVDTDGQPVELGGGRFMLRPDGSIVCNGQFTACQFAVMNHIAGNVSGKNCPPCNGVLYYNTPQIVKMKIRGRVGIHVMGEEGLYKKG